MQMGGAYPGDRFNDALYENPGFDNKWLSVQLVGTTSNRSAIGTHIHAVIEENGQERSIHRWIGSGGSFGCNPLRESLGLGKASEIKRLEIHWPASDETQVFESLPANQFLRITEGETQFETLSMGK